MFVINDTLVSIKLKFSDFSKDSQLKYRIMYH